MTTPMAISFCVKGEIVDICIERHWWPLKFHVGVSFNFFVSSDRDVLLNAGFWLGQQETEIDFRSSMRYLRFQSVEREQDFSYTSLFRSNYESS